MKKFHPFLYSGYQISRNCVQRTFTVMGKNHRTAGLLVNKIRFDQKQNMWLFVCSEAVESRLAKLETSCTAVPPPTVSGLCCVFH